MPRQNRWPMAEAPARGVESQTLRTTDCPVDKILGGATVAGPGKFGKNDHPRDGHGDKFKRNPQDGDCARITSTNGRAASKNPKNEPMQMAHKSQGDAQQHFVETPLDNERETRFKHSNND